MTPEQNIARVQRFSFANFKQSEPQPKQEEEILPLITEPVIDLEAQQKALIDEAKKSARHEGREQGYKEGYAAAEKKINQEAAAHEAAIKDLLEVISNRITLAAEAHTAYLMQQKDLMGKLVIAISRKIAGEALKREPYESIEVVLRECLGLIIGEPKVTFIVSPEFANGLRQRIEYLRPLLPGFKGELVVEENEAITGNDYRVEWRGGYAERDFTKLWNDVEAVISKTSMQ